MIGCVPTHQLKGNERLLYDIELKGLKETKPENIVALYRQKPNRKLPIIGGTPYLSVYYFGKHFFNPGKVDKKFQKKEKSFARKIEKAGSDSVEIMSIREDREKSLTKINRKKENGNLLMRSVGEPPAIYDSAKTVETVSQINTYLNSKGYFHNTVTFSTKERKKKIYLTLNVTEIEPYRFTELTNQIPDTALKRIVELNKRESLLHTGQNYDEELITKERDRLEVLLKNQGYYDFQKQFIFFDVDTTQGGNSVKMATIIDNPSENTIHKAYTIRNIYFVEDAALNRFGVKRDTIVYNRNHFLAYNQRVSPKVLSKKIRFKPGQKYSALRNGRTLRQITDLDVYRYVTINYNTVKDSLAPYLDAYINVMPSKRLQAYTEVGLNFSTFATSQLSPLPFFSERLKIRNIFGGAENLEIGLRAGFEGQPSTSESKVVTTTEIGGNVALYFPQFLIPFYHKDPLNTYNLRTRLNAAYTFTDRPDYTRVNTEISMSYFWNKSQFLQYVVSPIDINLIDVRRLSEAFDQRLTDYEKAGFPLRQSFKTGIVSSFNAARIYNTNDIMQTRDAVYFKLFGEIGNVPRVLSFGKLEWIPNWINDAKNDYKAYSFAKFSADFRKYKKISKLGPKTFVVGRIYTGVASPVPNNEGDILPYDKFFFSGGGSSNRAWRPRKLGPGSFKPPYREDTDGNLLKYDNNLVRNYDFEQPGEILLETNLEGRFNIFSVWDGAIFLDAGNVWTIDKDPARDGARFTTSFLSEMAVGGGIGFRFDFSFLIVRLDMATKIFDPAEPRGHRYVLNRFHLNGNTFKALNTQNSFNLGIGYPF